MKTIQEHAVTDSMDRREFMGRSIAIGGAAALPAASWARVAGANERIRLGVVGCGVQGLLHVRSFQRRADEENVTLHRVCDLYQPRLSEGARLAGVGPDRASMEYRDVLDDADVDAVVVATPDHWHAKLAIESLQSGKSVLLETPFSHTIEQAKELREASRAASEVVAVAARTCSDRRYHELHDLVLQSRIGKVSWSQASFCFNFRAPIFNRREIGQIGVIPGEETYLWWDRWLGYEWGLAPRVKLDAERFFRYQKFYDYSGGMVSEFLFQLLAGLLRGIAGPGGEEPASVTAGGGHYNLFDGREIADQVMAVIDYPSEHTITLTTSGSTSFGVETMVRARHAVVKVVDEGLHLAEEPDFYPEFRNINRHHLDAGMVKDQRGRWIPDPPKGEAEYSIDVEQGRDVNGNFLDAIRGEDRPHCGVELGFSTMVAIDLIVRSLRERRTFAWDRESGAVVGG